MGITVARWLAWNLPDYVPIMIPKNLMILNGHEILHQNHQCKKGRNEGAIASHQR